MNASRRLWTFWVERAKNNWWFSRRLEIYGLYCTVMERGLDQWVRMGRWKMAMGMGMGMSERGEVK